MCALWIDLHAVRSHELQRLAAALANFGRLLALADDAGLLKEAPTTHFAHNAIALDYFIEALERRFKRFIIINDYTCQENSPHFLLSATPS